jgi:hypothetical protein
MFSPRKLHLDSVLCQDRNQQVYLTPHILVVKNLVITLAAVIYSALSSQNWSVIHQDALTLTGTDTYIVLVSPLVPVLTLLISIVHDRFPENI